MPIISTTGQDDSQVQDNSQISNINDDLATNIPSVTPSRIQSTVNTPYSTQMSPSVSDDSLEDDFSDDIFDEPAPAVKNNKQQNAALSLSRMNEDQRRTAIQTVFSLVLGREPTERDYSYYRFSTLTEDGLIRSLLSLPEHKQAFEKAKEYPTLKQNVMDLDLRVKQMDSSVLSMQQELIALQQLLQEKNRYIQQIRGNGISYEEPQQYQNSEEHIVYTTQQVVEKRKLPTPFEEIKSLIRGLFSN